MKWPLIVLIIYLIIFDGFRYMMIERSNMIQVNIEPSSVEGATDVENGFACTMGQQVENINITTNKSVICPVGSEPIVTTPKYIRRYESSVLRAVNHAGQNKHVLPFGVVRSIHALKINKNRKKTRTWKPGSSKHRLR